jgi:hypothetical protein
LLFRLAIDAVLPSLVPGRLSPSKTIGKTIAKGASGQQADWADYVHARRCDSLGRGSVYDCVAGALLFDGLPESGLSRTRQIEVSEFEIKEFHAIATRLSLEKEVLACKSHNCHNIYLER